MHKLRRCAPYAVAPTPGLSICSDPSFSTFLLPAFSCWTIVCHLNAQTEALRPLCRGAHAWPLYSLRPFLLHFSFAGALVLVVCHLNVQTKAFCLLCCGARSWLSFAATLPPPLPIDRK